MNPAEITAWTANQERTRAEYERLPTVTGRNNINGPCIGGCGRRSKFTHGYCRVCRKEK